MKALDINNIDKTNWKKYRFEEIAASISERVEPGETDLDIYVGLEHLDAESLHIKRTGVPSDVSGTKLKVYKGDLIFGKRRAYQRKASIAHFDGICSAHAMVLRAKEKVMDPKLFPFFIHSDYFMHRAVDISVGGLSPTINWGTLKNQEFLLPPKDQQTKLAGLFWAVDEVMEKYSKLVLHLQGVIESACQEYFVKTTTPFVDLGRIADIIMGQSPDGSTYNSNEDGLALINGPTEFTERFPIKIQWTTKPSKLCKEGDILLCVRGSTTGRINISNDTYCIGRGVAAIRGTNGYLTKLIEYALIHFLNEIKRLSAGSTFPNIDCKSLKSIKIPNYSTNEQVLITKNLMALSSEREQVLTQLKTATQIQKQLTSQIFS